MSSSVPQLQKRAASVTSITISVVATNATSPPKGGIAERKAMIDREHDLPISKQAEVLRISRGSVYYLPRPVTATGIANSPHTSSARS
jgi:hypothetical protein